MIIKGSNNILFVEIEGVALVVIAFVPAVLLKEIEN